MEDVLGNLMERFSATREKLSPTQLRIGSYLLKHYEKAAFMTASRLAQTVGTSESSIIRFAHQLGFSGFPELQQHLRRAVVSRLSTVSRLKESTGGSRGQPIAERVLSSDLGNLTRTIEALDLEDLKRAARVISAAPRVFIVGVRSSHCLGLFMGMYLELIGKDVRVLPHPVVSMLEQLAGVNREDVIVGISFPRYASSTRETLAYVRPRVDSIIALTDSPASPVVELADLVLYCESSLDSFIESCVAQLSVINALVSQVASVQPESTEKHLRQMEDLWDQFGFFAWPR